MSRAVRCEHAAITVSPADGGRCQGRRPENKAVIKQARYAFRPSAATLPYGLTYNYGVTPLLPYLQHGFTEAEEQPLGHMAQAAREPAPGLGWS